MKSGRLGLTVVISLCAVMILIFIQVYVVHEYFQLKSRVFDTSYAKIITKALDEVESQIEVNPFDSIYLHFDRVAYQYIPFTTFDTTYFNPKIRKQIKDSLEQILIKHDPNSIIITDLLKNNQLDTVYSSKYVINEFSILNFDQKINIYQRDIDNTTNGNAIADIYIKSYEIEGDYFLVRFDYYVDFTWKSKTIYNEMRGLLIAVICTILVVLFAFTYSIRMLNSQKKLSELKSDFIDQITHEFKTPLSSIAVAVSSLKLPIVQQSSQKINELADIIRKQYQFLSGMIDYVLETGLIERKKMELTRRSIPVKSYVQEIVNSFRIENQDKSLIINEHYEIDDEVTYQLDPLLFSRVITNLLGNSVKYTINLPVIIDIRITEANALFLEFTDNGIGIPKGHLKSVFNKFHRVENGLTSKVKGLGLGLYITSKIVEAHGGIIEIKSEIGKGTSVQIKLTQTK